MSYVKKINGYIIKDEEARQDIQNIKSSLTGAMHYIGRNVPVSGQTPISDGAIAGPWNITGQTYNTQRFGVIIGGGMTSKYIRNKELDEHTGTDIYYAYSLTDYAYDSPSTLYVRDATITTSTTLYENRSSPTFEPIVYDHSIYSEDIYNLTSEEKQPDFGSVATYQASPTSRELEFVFGPDGWSEFGSTGSLKALAFKDTANVTASGSCTPQGTNAASVVTFQTPGELPTMVYDSVNETLTFNQGSFPSGGVAAAQIFTGSNTDVSVSGTAS